MYIYINKFLCMFSPSFVSVDRHRRILEVCIADGRAKRAGTAGTAVSCSEGRIIGK